MKWKLGIEYGINIYQRNMKLKCGHMGSISSNDLNWKFLKMLNMGSISINKKLKWIGIECGTNIFKNKNWKFGNFN